MLKEYALRPGLDCGKVFVKIRGESALMKGEPMTLSVANLQPIVSLLAGILILIIPRLLNYIVAAFLIVSGLLGLGVVR